MGTLVDGAKLNEIAKQIYALQYGEPIDCSIDDLLFVELKVNDDYEKKYAVICTEGVGWESNGYEIINVPTSIGSFNIWNGRVPISVKVIQSCLTNQRVDIAEYVRVFGDRLDTNVAKWQAVMEK
jgi:hypothetical protein